jgi:hypothetical protein
LNAEQLKYDWSDLYWDVPQPRPWKNSPCTCRLQGIPDYKASSRCQVQEVYLWSTTSGVNIQVWIHRRPDDVAV